MIVFKWLVDKEPANLKKSFPHFELISTVLELMPVHCKIRTKMLIKIEILLLQVASHIFLNWSIGFMIKMLI